MHVTNNNSTFPDCIYFNNTCEHLLKTCKSLGNDKKMS